MGVPGVANVAIWGQREQQLQVQVDPARLAGERRHARPGHRDHRQRPVGVAADLPRGVDPGHRRVHRHAEPAPRRPARPADHDARGPRRRSSSRTTARTRHAAPRRRGRRGRGPPAADRRRRVRRRPRPAARRREVPGGQHPRGDPRRRGGARRPRARPVRGRGRHVTSSGRRELHRDGDRQPARRRCSSAWCCSLLGARSRCCSTGGPRSISARRHPAVARRPRCRAATWCETTSTRWCSPAWCWRSWSSSTTRSATSEPIARRIRERRARRDPVRVAAASSSTPSLEVRSAVALRDRSIVARALVPVFFLDGRGRRVLAAARPASYAVAVLASMLVALTVTPALSVLLLSGGRGDRRDVRRVPVARGRATSGRRLADRRLARARRVVVVASSLLGRDRGARPFLERIARLPRSRTPTCWSSLDGAPARRCRRWTGSRPGRRRAARAPGRRSVGGHVGRAVSSTRSSASTPSELWVSLDPAADYDADGGRDRGGRRRLSRARPRASSTYPQERIDDVLAAGADGTDLTVRVFGQDLDILRGQGRARCSRCSSGDRRRRAPRVELRPRSRPSRSRSTSTAARALRHQAGRRPAGGGHAALGHPGRQPVRGAEDLRGRGVGHAGDPHTACRASRTC